MSNPFDDDEAMYLVLINDEGQHSLWPAFASVLDGWQQVSGPSARQECLAYVEEHWTDMRPNSLIRAMGS